MKISDPNPSPPPPYTYNIAQIVCYTQNANEQYQKQDHHYPCFSCLVCCNHKTQVPVPQVHFCFSWYKNSSRISFVLHFCKYCAHRETAPDRHLRNDILLQFFLQKSDFQKCLINFCRNFFFLKALWILGLHMYASWFQKELLGAISRLWVFLFAVL